MKYTNLIAAALLTASASSASGFGLNFYHPLLGGFQGFTPGTIWGVVVNTGSDSFDFSALENLRVDQFERGVNTSGQWLNDSMLYLTGGDGSSENPLNVTNPAGAMLTLSGLSYNSVDASGDAYTIAPNSTFALIWFDIHMMPETPGDPIVPDPSKNDSYGFLTVQDETDTTNGFRIPAGDGNGLFYEHVSRQIDRMDNLSFAPVPEPATYALLLSGLALGGCVLRRRNRKVAA